MDEEVWLAERFEQHRSPLRAVAYRMLGSLWEADDAVQETWLRLSRANTSGVENLGAWLTTIVARVCLNMLSARCSRREDSIDVHLLEPQADGEDNSDPEQQALLADSVGVALLVIVDTLPPAERLAFVLHDLFDVPFDEIAALLERSPVAVRQLASRARRRVRGASAAPVNDPRRHGEIVAAFLATSRGGEFERLLVLLDPDVVVRADPAAVEMGTAAELRGAAAVADAFVRRFRGGRPALINGALGAVWAPRKRPRVAFLFTVARERITSVELVADPEQLQRLDLDILDAQ